MMFSAPFPQILQRRGLMLVLSSPSGAGKSTIARELLRRDPQLSMSVSLTTRPRRPGEEEGRDYYFVDPAAFAARVARKELLEHAQVFGNQYGTPRAPVEHYLKAGRDVLFDIDWQGTQQLSESAADDLVRIFILPPSAAELERRLNARAQDSREEIARRMAKAHDEMSHWSEYDYVIINEDVENSVTTALAILNVERLKRRRQIGLSDFVRALKAGATP
jgi:guanylate kinase